MHRCILKFFQDGLPTKYDQLTELHEVYLNRANVFLLTQPYRSWRSVFAWTRLIRFRRARAIGSNAVWAAAHVSVTSSCVVCWLCSAESWQAAGLSTFSPIDEGQFLRLLSVSYAGNSQVIASIKGAVYDCLRFSHGIAGNSMQQKGRANDSPRAGNWYHSRVQGREGQDDLLLPSLSPLLARLINHLTSSQLVGMSWVSYGMGVRPDGPVV